MDFLKSAQFGVIHDCMDTEAVHHEIRVAVLLVKLVQFIPDEIKTNYGLSDEELRRAFYKGGRYHDIGKVALRYPLFKAADAFPCATMLEILRQHTIYGRGYLLEYADGLFFSDAEKQICTDMAVYHHERYDGTGYPFGLSDDIPFAAQLCALANHFDNFSMEAPLIFGKQIVGKRAFESTAADEGLAGKNAFSCFMAAKNPLINQYRSNQPSLREKDMLAREHRILRDPKIHMGTTYAEG